MGILHLHRAVGDCTPCPEVLDIDDRRSTPTAVLPHDQCAIGLKLEAAHRTVKMAVVAQSAIPKAITAIVDPDADDARVGRHLIAVASHERQHEQHDKGEENG